MKRIASIALLCLCLTACDKRPEKVLSEGKLVDVMTDLEIADAYYNSGYSAKNRTYNLEEIKASVLKKHGVTGEELDSTIAYYGRNIDDYYRIYNKVEQKLKKRNKSGDMEKEVEENNFWPYSDYALLTRNQTSNGIVFSIPMNGMESGSSIEWRMRLTATEGAEAVLGVEYENGTSSIIKKSASGNKNFKIPLQTDTAEQVKRVFGVMSSSSSAMPVWVDSIRLVKMEFDSLNYNRINQQKTIRPPRQKPLHAEPAPTVPATPVVAPTPVQPDSVKPAP